jgi:hypothetical protein
MPYVYLALFALAMAGALLAAVAIVAHWDSATDNGPEKTPGDLHDDPL